MEKTEIAGSGNALMSIIRGLFDDTYPGITTTGKRKMDDVASVGYVSMLGAMTPTIWKRCMEGRDSYGTGLGGRFNLVASNEDRTSATLMPMDMGELHGALEEKLHALENRPEPLTILTEAAALDVLTEWWAQSRGHSHYNRVNVILHRKALHIAWLRGLPVITKEVMEHAVKLGDYLVGIRDAYAVTRGEDKVAIAENRILHILRQIAPSAVRLSQLVDLLDGDLSRSTIQRCLASLIESREAEKHMGESRGGRPHNLFRLAPKKG